MEKILGKEDDKSSLIRNHIITSLIARVIRVIFRLISDGSSIFAWAWPGPHLFVFITAGQMDMTWACNLIVAAAATAAGTAVMTTSW